MIQSVETINMPTSGKYIEVIYDIPSAWNSQKWTWLKFTNSDFTEWCGEFRGEYRGHGISVKHGVVYVLTSDYLYQLDINNSAILSYEDQPEYKQLSALPKGDCVVADYYHISILDNKASDVCS